MERPHVDRHPLGSWDDASAGATSGAPRPASAPDPDPVLEHEPAEPVELTADEQRRERQSGLFGRGLLYVIVFSMQTVIATVVSPVLAHLVGPVEFGWIATAIALVQMLVVFNVLGLDQAVVLQRSEDSDDRSSRGLLMVGIVLATTVTGLLALTAGWWGPFLGFGPLSPLLLGTLVWTFAGGCTAVVLGLLLSEDRLRLVTIVTGIAGVGGPLLGVALVALRGPTATSYVIGVMSAQVVAMLIAVVAVRPRPRGLRELRTAQRAFAIGFPIAISGMAGFVLNAGDRIVIQRLLGPAQVGRYQVAYTIGYVVILLLMFTSQAWAPRFAEIRDRTARLALTEQTRNELYRLLMPVVLGITLAAPVVLLVVAPASFDRQPLVLVVFLIAISAFPVAASGASTRELFTLRKGRALAVAGVTAAVVNIGLNLWLIPPMGIAGAAVATALALSLQGVLQLLSIPERHLWPRTPARIWLGVAAICVLGLISTQLPQTLGWNLARIAAGLACLPWFVSRLVTARTGEPLRWRSLGNRPRPRRAG